MLEFCTLCNKLWFICFFNFSISTAWLFKMENQFSKLYDNHNTSPKYIHGTNILTRNENGFNVIRSKNSLLLNHLNLLFSLLLKIDMVKSYLEFFSKPTTCMQVCNMLWKVLYWNCSNII